MSPATIPDCGARDRCTDERPERQAAEEHRVGLPLAGHHAVARRFPVDLAPDLRPRHGDGSASLGRAWGPSTAMIATAMIPTQASTDAPIRWKSPI